MVIWFRVILQRKSVFCEFHTRHHYVSPSSNGIAERKMHIEKTKLKAFSPFSESMETYLPRLLLSYRQIKHVERNQSPV